MSEMKKGKTGGGFTWVAFKDRYAVGCRIAESSVTSEEAIVLGTDESPMHLTKEMVADLIPYLIGFLMHGNLNRNKDEDDDE